jgi:hypothetical protein
MYLHVKDIYGSIRASLNTWKILFTMIIAKVIEKQASEMCLMAHNSNGNASTGRSSLIIYGSVRGVWVGWNVTLHALQTWLARCKKMLFDIWGSHGGEDVDGGLLGCDAIWTCAWVPTFRRNIASIFTYKSTRLHNSEDSHRQKLLFLLFIRAYIKLYAQFTKLLNKSVLL